MQGERKVIRDGFKAAIDSVFAGETFTKRKVDARNKSEYVNVFFEDGEITHDGLDGVTSAEIIVGYHTREYLGDDELDSAVNPLYQAISAADIASDVIRGILPTGFYYGDEQEGEFTSMFLQFRVVY